MEPFYDSEEEIAWGPVTLKEIKDNLKRNPIKKIDRRHTAFGKFLKENKTMDSTNVSSNTSNKQVPNLLEEMNSKLNISGISSEYFTPNETASTNFLEKLSKVINEPLSECSNYLSAADTTYMSNSKVRIESVKKDVEGTFSLDKLKHDLVENTIILSSDDECEEFIKTKIKIEKNEEETLNFLNASNEVICIDDDSTDEDVGYFDDSLSKEVKCINYSLDEGNDDNIIYYCHNEDKEDVDTNSENKSENLENSNENLDEANDDNDYIQENIDTNSEVESLCSNSKSEHLNVSENPNRHEMSGGISPIQIPEIDIKQFDDSSNSSSDFGFNDTMEEIERALQQGLDYSMSDSDVIEATPKKGLESSNSKEHTDDESSSISSYTPKSSSIPRLNKNHANTIFKIPNQPAKPKLPVKSSLHLENKYKNIISPVRIYINNSPKVCLKQNVPNIERNMLASPKKNVKKQANKENALDFPAVIYKPAKKQITTHVKDVNLPSSIRKLVLEPTVVKHVARYNNHNLNETAIERKLLQEDLTTDDSLLNTTNEPDVSVLVSKQAFIK